MASTFLRGLVFHFFVLGCLAFDSNGQSGSPISIVFASCPEQITWSQGAAGVRTVTLAPRIRRDTPPLLIVYATPNGNTLEQTLGCGMIPGRDFHFDIQHVAAQVRRLSEVDQGKDIILAVVQAPKLSWPSFLREEANGTAIVRELVDSLATRFATHQIVLTGHSGGGSFMFGYLNSAEDLPDSVERVIFLDANYAYSDQERHGDKLWNWLQGDVDRHLVVIAYDDREITLEGKKVVGPTGGTYRATQRMLDYFGKRLEWIEEKQGSFRTITARNGQLRFLIHPNPENKILHTALVGEMNGLLHGLTVGSPFEEKWGTLGGPRAYTDWIQPEPFTEQLSTSASIDANTSAERLHVPGRKMEAEVGSVFALRMANASPAERETATVEELLSGNVPNFLRTLVPLQVSTRDTSGNDHTAIYFVTADYLAVGTDEDFIRVPMTPMSANRVAESWQASLITTKISDDIFAAATTRLDPQPLTEDRESPLTFLRHHQLIEDQLPAGTRPRLIGGIKKDVVLSKRLKEGSKNVAIYGWHHPDGRPIQPLYVGHRDTYVDYSHGIRLVAQRILVDGHAREFNDVLKDPQLAGLVTTEGP